MRFYDKVLYDGAVHTFTTLAEDDGNVQRLIWSHRVCGFVVDCSNGPKHLAKGYVEGLENACLYAFKKLT